MLGGQDAVVVWKFNEESRKLSQTSVTLGKVKRSITNLLVSNFKNTTLFIKVGSRFYLNVKPEKF